MKTSGQKLIGDSESKSTRTPYEPLAKCSYGDRKSAMSRRKFMEGTIGLASGIIASGAIGNYGMGHGAWAAEAPAGGEAWPKGQFGIVDCNALYPYPAPAAGAGLIPLSTFCESVFLGSETSMIVMVGMPSREKDSDQTGKLLGMARGTTSSWATADARDTINQIAECQRALSLGNCAPNHYWDARYRQPDYPALYDQMEREAKLYKIAGWNWSCHADPGQSGGGFTLNDAMATKFYQKARELGVKVFSISKGFASQSRSLGALANPADVEQAALRNPDLTFIIRNAALMQGPQSAPGKVNPNYLRDIAFNPDSGGFLWFDTLIDIKKRNPTIENIYVEFDAAFSMLASDEPLMCQHLLGKAIQVYGVDHILWGTGTTGGHQRAIEAFKGFQITDEITKKFGYSKLTTEDKQKVLAFNAARVYGIDFKSPRKGLPSDWRAKLAGGETALVSDFRTTRWHMNANEIRKAEGSPEKSKRVLDKIDVVDLRYDIQLLNKQCALNYWLYKDSLIGAQIYFKASSVDEAKAYYLGYRDLLLKKMGQQPAGVEGSLEWTNDRTFVRLFRIDQVVRCRYGSGEDRAIGAELDKKFEADRPKDDLNKI